MAVRRRPAQGPPGRHFLRSSRLASDFVRETGVAARDLVVDIGAGAGALTRALADAGAEVLALELAADLARELRRRFDSNRAVTVIEADALDWEWPARPFAVVANLPFARSGAILAHMLRDPRGALRRADVVVQWDFARKHAAVWPATLKSTYWRAWYDVTVTGHIARTAFSPPPSVDAAIVRFERRRLPLVPAHDSERYWRFLSEAFRAHLPVRRALGAQLPALQVKRLAPTLGFAPDARARDLDARQWAAIYAVARGVPPVR
ncbi:MAG TPA: rRNA adenine dimethyltransferase family protein [Gaiellaceae bacterium]|nr:rRNA adenine dimethyltransferase family protein [Gaiellaceae bacterium]